VKESGTPTPAKQSSLDVKEDWNIYVQAIIQGKSFVFNGFADEVRLKSFDGSDIVIEAGSQDIFLVFKQWKKYFEDKVLEVFKRRFNVEFVLSDNPRGNTEEAQVNSAVEKKSASRAIDPNDPVVKFIKEDLGGEQVQ
jgi:hypothetical protein